MKEYIEKLRFELIKDRNYIDRFSGEFYEGQRVVYDSLIDQLTEELETAQQAPEPVEEKKWTTDDIRTACKVVWDDLYLENESKLFVDVLQKVWIKLNQQQ